MNHIQYKVSASGKIQAYNGKQRLSDLSLEVVPSLAQRKILRSKLPRATVQMAWAIFGTRCHPADLMDVHPDKKWFGQVFADSPKAMLIVRQLVKSQALTATAANATNLVLRAKNILTNRGSATGASKKKFEVTKYWERRSSLEVPLTDAGWRWLVNLPFASLRVIGDHYPLKGLLGYFNLLAELKVPHVTPELLEFSSYGTKGDQLRKVLAAYYKSENPVFKLDAETKDFLRDALYADDFATSTNPTWARIIMDAYEYAAQAAELKRPELEGLRWTAAMPHLRIDLPRSETSFEAKALVNGVELLEEGYEMKNCLRNMVSYAKRGAQGTSLVYTLSGPQRATVELVRNHKSDSWRMAQVALSCNRQVFDGPVWLAAKKLCHMVDSHQKTAAAVEMTGAV